MPPTSFRVTSGAQWEASFPLSRRTTGSISGGKRCSRPHQQKFFGRLAAARSDRLFRMEELPFRLDPILLGSAHRSPALLPESVGQIGYLLPRILRFSLRLRSHRTLVLSEILSVR